MSVHALRPTTAEEANAAFLSYLKRRNRSAKTLQRYAPVLDRFAEWARDRRLSELDASELDFGFFAEWTEQFEARNGREPSAQTLRAVHTTLSSLYRFLTSYGLLTDDDGRPVPNPMLAVEPPKVTRRRNDWLRRQEDEKLLETPMDSHEEILVHLLRWTGLRLGEALALRISDVDLDEKTITVTDSKTENGIRQVPIAPELVPRIRAWLSYLEAKGTYRAHGYFLCTTRQGNWRDPKTGEKRTSEAGSPMKPQQVEKVIKRVGERAGIEGLTPHRLRRTFGSFFLNEGMRLETVSNLLGHGDTRVTQQAYASLENATVRREMMQALGA
jgi:integrase